MENVFRRHFKLHSQFAWGRMGDVDEGRPTLGEDCPVLVYRLMEQTLIDTLTTQVGVERTQEHLYAAGHMSGYELAMNRLVLEAPHGDFFDNLSDVLKELGMGLLTVKEYKPDTQEIKMNYANLLDCGVGNRATSLNYYNRGMLAGIMEAYTAKSYDFEDSIISVDNCSYYYVGKPSPETTPA